MTAELALCATTDNLLLLPLQLPECESASESDSDNDSNNGAYASSSTTLERTDTKTAMPAPASMPAKAPAQRPAARPAAAAKKPAKAAAAIAASAGSTAAQRADDSSVSDSDAATLAVTACRNKSKKGQKGKKSTKQRATAAGAELKATACHHKTVAYDIGYCQTCSKVNWKYTLQGLGLPTEPMKPMPPAHFFENGGVVDEQGN
jgi:hypothetical protein